ncbi:MAG TPA: hypothetical protein VGA50_04790 [Kiloniellales bacterium]
MPDIPTFPGPDKIAEVARILGVSEREANELVTAARNSLWARDARRRFARLGVAEATLRRSTAGGPADPKWSASDA